MKKGKLITIGDQKFVVVDIDHYPTDSIAQKPKVEKLVLIGVQDD